MKLSKILAILMTVLVSPVISFASEDGNQSEREYVKLIEEGKTWEYIHGDGYFETGDFFAFQMRFEGTETRNGVEYHKLVYCGNLTTWYTENCEARPLIVSNLLDRPNDIDAYYLMREEDGKVYLYIKDLIEKKINSDDAMGNPECGGDSIGDETIIYDFTKNDGDIINNVLCNWGTRWGIYPIRPTHWWCSDMYVCGVSEIDLNGKRVIKQSCGEVMYIGETLYTYDRYSCIEGVGVDSSGFLPFIDVHPFTAGHDFSYYNLNCLYDADGEIIYKAKDDAYVDVAELVRLADVEQPVIAPSIVQNNDGIKAENAVITLYDLSGRMVVSDHETVSTTSLQPGVYIAKAESPSGISTLKIRID